MPDNVQLKTKEERQREEEAPPQEERKARINKGRINNIIDYYY